MELLVLVVMLICLGSILYPFFQQKKRSAEVVLAVNNVQYLYQNQLLYYFSTSRFLYSMTRVESWPDFYSAKPPFGKAEKLVGYPGDEKFKGKKSRYHFSAWKRIGFPLTRPSYFIYRVEPEPSYSALSKIQEKTEKNPYHFHAMAIGDSDGDGRFSVLMRGGYVDAKGMFQGMTQTFVADFVE